MQCCELGDSLDATQAAHYRVLLVKQKEHDKLREEFSKATAELAEFKKGGTHPCPKCGNDPLSNAPQAQGFRRQDSKVCPECKQWPTNSALPKLDRCNFCIDALVTNLREENKSLRASLADSNRFVAAACAEGGCEE